MADSFGARSFLEVGGENYEIYRLDAIKEGHVDRLPYSLKILLENLLRHEDGRDVTRDDILALAMRKPETDASRFPPPLRVSQATFVTLTCRGKLRGCMGSLRATRPLVCDVASNAYSAAFLDPRFSPLTLLEADDLDTHISILSPPEAMQFESEADLLAQLRAAMPSTTLRLVPRDGASRLTMNAPKSPP